MDTELSELEKLLKTYYLISGMNIAVYDRQFHSLARSGPPVINFCSLIHKNQEGLNVCFRSDLDAFTRVSKNSSPYVYNCPFGLYEAVVPIKENDMIIGYLFAGQSIEDTKEAAAHALTSALPYISESYPTASVEDYIRQLPRHSEKELEAFGKTLEVFANYIVSHNLISNHTQSVGELIKKYVKQNFQHKITLSELSLQLHCSTVTLTENFRREFGVTIMQYVNQKRMEHAEILLHDSAIPVRDIAERCGFSNIEYFSKFFKSTHGLSPLAWRREKIAEHGEKP